MLSTNTVTDSQIHALRTESAVAGDIMQVAICDLALDPTIARLVRVGTVEYALEQDERTRLVAMTQDEAREACAETIADAAAQA